MTIADRRERDRRLRRDSIIDAAESLFFTKGFPATTIDEIAAAAELSKGTIYLYFKTKEEIFVAIVQRGLHLLADMVREATAKASTGKGRIRAIGQALLTFYQRHPGHFTAMFYQHDGPSCLIPADDRGGPLIKALIHDREGLYAYASEAIRSGIADGSIPSDVDPLKQVIVFVGMILGLIRMVAVEEKFLRDKFHISGEDLIQAAFDMIGQLGAGPRKQELPKGA